MEESEIKAALDALSARVAALEDPAASAGSDVPPGTPGPGELDAGLLERLQGRSGPPFEEGEVRGSVLYAGVARVGGGSYVWQMERPVPGLLATDDEQIADVLAAIASPVRLRLLKAVLGGAHETQELQSALGGVSTGQLYHHLKELIGVGILAQQARGRYEVAPHAVVPVLAVLAAGFDLA